MESQGDANYAGVVDEFNSLYVLELALEVLKRLYLTDSRTGRLNSNYCNVAAIGTPFVAHSYQTKVSNNAYHLAFLFFDWLLGLRLEISLFWTGASTAATALYATTRYMTLVENVIYVIQLSQMSDKAS